MIDIEQFYLDNRREYLKRLSSWVGSSNAEDVFQESITRVMEHWDRFKDEDDLDRFSERFYGVVLNCVRDFRNHDRGVYHESLDEFNHPSHDRNRHSPGKWNEVLYSISNEEDPRKKEVFTLFFIDGLTVKQIGEIVKVTYFRAYRDIQKFKRQLRLNIKTA